MRSVAAPVIELAILSREGGRDYNEDACGHWHSDRHLVCVVADGAGGHGGGDVAARIAVRHIIERCAAVPIENPGSVEALLLETNAAVIRERVPGTALAQMHSTVVGLFIDIRRAEALWGHAGDSRLYHFRNDRILSRTLDHSVVQSMVDAGVLAPELMRTHPRRSELLSALGSDSAHLHFTAAPAVIALRPGDVFLLCTDGLWEYVDEDEMCRSLSGAGDPQAWLALLERAVVRNAAAQHKPRHDNFSGIAVWFGVPETQ